MFGSATPKTASATDLPDAPRSGAGLTGRKIWLPKLIYSALPWFYVGSGIAAFMATLYINEWFWILPHYLLFSIACVHLGLIIFRRRLKASDDT